MAGYFRITAYHRPARPLPTHTREGSTLSTSSHGRGGRGYRYYRLIATSESGSPESVTSRFWLTGTRHYRNADKVVHLYNYLLAGARKAAATRSRRTDTHRHPGHRRLDLIGPFEVRIPLTLNATDGHPLVDADGFTMTARSQPGTDSTCGGRRHVSATLTATTPHNLNGRV